jgi:PAS domain S-box-containing protein
MQVKSVTQNFSSLHLFPLNNYLSKISVDFSHPSESIILIDTSGKITYINQAFSEFSGYSRDEITGLNFGSMLPGKISGYFYENLREKILSGIDWIDCLELRKKNGNLEIVKMEITPVKNEKLEVTQFIITRKGTSYCSEEEKKISGLVKLGYFGNIFCSLMHELKSHFALIKMNFNLLKPSNDSEKTIYSIIERDLERVNKLFFNFSQLSKDKEPEIIGLNVHNVIDYSYSSAQSLHMDKTISFINNVEPVIIQGDYQKLKCVFKNLIENAMDAIENTGEIELCSKKSKGYFYIYIKDNGTGIKNCDKIFEPFYTTKSNGTGLGLAIVKKIIEEHKAAINLLKCRDGRTVFEIKYPYKIE